MEEFEGFTQNELNGNSNPEVMLVESDLSDAGKESLVSEEEEEDEGEKATPRRRRPRRSSIGLRVAFQFPTKKLTKKSDDSSSEPLFSSTRLQDNKKQFLEEREAAERGRKGKIRSQSLRTTPGMRLRRARMLC